MKLSFTIIELIFVIIIIGILAGVALPRLFTSVNDAEYAKAKTQIAAIRAGISSSYSKNIMSGVDECPKIEKDYDDDYLFEAVLRDPIKKNSGDIKWNLKSHDDDKNEYSIKIGDEEATMTYDKNSSKGCTFKCTSGALCDKLQ